MNEENNNIPALRSATDITNDELRQYWLDPAVDYPEPRFLYEFHGVGFSPLGGIQAISGQKKNGKTFVLAQLMAVALGSGSDKIAEYLPGLTTRATTVEYLGHDPVVLYCDTEMEKLNTAKVLRRVHWLCGWDMKLHSERFHVLWLREVPATDMQSSNKERWRLIKKAIEQINPDIVFVDGLRDLVNDFNDNAESSAIVGEMMSVASHRNLCIWNVLHMNPRPSNDDESKMRGHLGTELGNKVSDTFMSIKKKDVGTGEVTFTVKQQDARGKDIDDWQFQVTDDAGVLGIPKIITRDTTTPAAPEHDPEQTISQWLSKAEHTYEWPMTRSDVKKKVFGEIGGVTNHGKQQADLTVAINKGWLEESTIKKNGSYMLQLNTDDLPF